MKPNISRRYKAKYDIEINAQEIAHIFHTYGLSPKDNDPETLVLTIPDREWELVEFVIRVLSQFIVGSKVYEAGIYTVRLHRKSSDLRFIITSRVTPETHPWLDEHLEVGEFIVYSEMPHYGVVNLYQGIPILYNSGTIQINYEHVALMEKRQK